MDTTILTEQQIIFLNELRKDEYIRQHFYLAGGTALAEFYLHHRYSDDLDFFTAQEFDKQRVDTFIHKIKTLTQVENVYRRIVFDRLQFELINKEQVLKVEFVKYEFPLLKPLKMYNGLQVADILDIAVGKLFAIQDRTEVKDFVDLYFLLQQYDIETLIEGVEKKYGFKIHTMGLGGDLLKIRHIHAMPRMIKDVTKEQLTTFFEHQALKLSKDILS